MHAGVKTVGLLSPYISPYPQHIGVSFFVLLRPEGVSNKTQCAYKRTLRLLCEAIVAVEKQ